MRIVFIGASAFGLKCLRAASEVDGCEIVGVLTAPRKFPISYRPEGVVNVLYADVSSFCRSLNAPCLLMENGMNDPHLFGEISCLKPDVFIVAGWYHMLPRAWREEIAPAYGLHASLLPDYSGGAPLVWSIINGESKTGITFFQFADGVDSGPIVGQKETRIFEDDTIATLYERIEQLGIQLITEHLPQLVAGTATLLPQEEEFRRIFPQRAPEDGLIDWTRTNNDLYNFIRAQTRPYPGAFTLWMGKKITFWESRKIDDLTESEGTAGELIDFSDRLLVRTGSGILEILSLSFEGKDMTGAVFKEFVCSRVLFGE